jgi:ribosomal protein S18 acetylase RimI-like enzyme
MKDEGLKNSTYPNKPKTNVDSDVQIRPADVSDRDFIFSLLPRLVEFEIPSCRTQEQMTAGDRRVLERALSTNPPGTAVFIAQDSDRISLGFIHLTTAVDYYTEEKHGHISDIVVASAGEGRGIGRLLMTAGEEWAREQGYRLMTLSVFLQNTRARKLYEKLGFGEVMLRYIKEIR